MSEQVDVALGVLDHQLLDSDDRRCGKVDDVELEGLDGDSPRVKTILAGPPGWRSRGRVGRLAARMTRGRTSHIDWSEVVKIDSAVHLRGRATDYGLGRGDKRARRWVEWIPGAK
jgi:sporulation protein YlmC with PRC-barrel domain